MADASDGRARGNNVWVNELAGHRAFESWLDQHGLTLAEVARIQVPYVDDGIVPKVSSRYWRPGAGA